MNFVCLTHPGMNTAVILSARKERDSQIPYPLMPFSDDITLLRRSIDILREIGVSKIYVVVGYQADMFKSYEADDVQLIVNPDFEFTSSMASLAMVKNLIIDDFLLVEGDTFYEKDVLKRLSEVPAGNCFVMTEESGSGDECYVETKSGFITKISKDRHFVRRFEGELLGLARISYSTFLQLVAAWESSDNSYLNYEYLVMDVTDVLDRPVLKFKNLIWGEVDNMKDFKKLQNDIYRKLRKKEDPFDKENLLLHLSFIFPNKDVSSAQISQIGGMSNKNFRVDFHGRKYVLRVPGNGSEGMVVRSFEEFNSMEGSKLGINPPVHYFNSETGIKLVDYVEDAETLNAATIQRHDNMKKIANIYRTLHHSHVRLKNEFNVFREIEKYDSLMKKTGAAMYEGWENVRSQVMALESQLNNFGVDLHPCHNDAVPENFLKAKDGTVYLIDWEYSGMNDPMADFAALFLESEFSIENQDYMLSHYFEGDIPDNAMPKILCYQVLWDYLWSQWTVIKEAKGDDFGTYGRDRYNRAKELLSRINH